MNIKLVREVIYNEISKYYNCNKIDIYPYDSHLLININYSEKEPEINVHKSVINITDGYWRFPSIVPLNIDGYYSTVEFKLVNDGYGYNYSYNDGYNDSYNYSYNISMDGYNTIPTNQRRVPQHTPIHYLERSGLDSFVIDRIKDTNYFKPVDELQSIPEELNKIIKDELKLEEKPELNSMIVELKELLKKSVTKPTDKQKKEHLILPGMFNFIKTIINKRQQNNLQIDFDALKILGYKPELIKFIKSNLFIDFDKMKNKTLSNKYIEEFDFACQLYIRQYGGKIVKNILQQSSVITNTQHIPDINIMIFAHNLLNDINKNLKEKDNRNKFSKIISHIRSIKDVILHG